MQRILMVCLGNICRSPLAEGLLQKKINEEGVDAQVDSAGTAGYHIGESPDPRSTANAKQNGVDISALRARQFSAQDFDHFDMIYVMDRSNREHVLNLAQSEFDENKVRLILEELTPGSAAEVPDPYHGGEAGFQHVFDLLDRATDRIIEQL